MQEYAAEPEGEAFAQSRTYHAEIEVWLSSGEAAGLRHADLEDQLQARGRELLRRMHQDHLDLLAAREQRRDDVTGADGIRRTRAEKGHHRPLATVFGQVTVTRMAYRAPGTLNVRPLDMALNLPEEKQSHGLRKLAAVESARGLFEEAAAAITRATGVKTGKRQVEELARRAAVDVDAFYAGRRPGPASDEHVLVLTGDGKGIVMRPDALRPATAKAAARGRNKLATRLSPGEKHGRKRMAELACVYDVPVPRMAGDIITPPGMDKPARSRGPRATGKWLTASVTDDIPAVIAAAFSEAERRDPEHRRTWIALVDGNNQQIEAIKAEAARRGVAVPVICDFIHALEYIWKAAWSFFEPGDPDAEPWVAVQAAKILDGKAAQVAAGIRRRATTFGYSPAEREGADACADYLTAKKPHLDYATALAAGWPIATGVIEGACRHLVKDRMDITGARWGLDGAEAILKLRALISKGNFDQYWRFHLRKEHERVHHAHYREGFILAA
ncbi:MAG: ISKra4 family transposase [Actinomycetota bacterium]|nr:ISKra4 family transposase [Actinomycetota bacterium]